MINMSLATLYMLSLPPVLITAAIARRVFRTSWRALWVRSLFVLYLLSVLKFTLLPMPMPSLAEDLRAIVPDAVLRVNYRPLWLGEHFVFLDIEQVLNILLFVPFGVLFGLLARGRTGITLLGGLIASAAIETLQLILCLVIGFPYRVIDVNDLIYNFAGACIGLGLLKIGSFAASKLTGHESRPWWSG